MHTVDERNMELCFNRKLLRLEYAIVGLSLADFFAMVFAAAYSQSLEPVWRVVLVAVGTASVLVGSVVAVKIEHDAGYYECPHCGARHVPSLAACVFAPHMWRSRLFRCPACGQRGYHKKVLTKD